MHLKEIMYSTSSLHCDASYGYASTIVSIVSNNTRNEIKENRCKDKNKTNRHESFISRDWGDLLTLELETTNRNPVFARWPQNYSEKRFVACKKPEERARWEQVHLIRKLVGLSDDDLTTLAMLFVYLGWVFLQRNSRVLLHTSSCIKSSWD